MDLAVLKYFYLYYFHPKIIKDSLKRRRGECKRCGNCCRDILDIKGINCPFLKDNNSCKIYNVRKYIPIVRTICCFLPVEECRTRVKSCGYYWDDKGSSK